MSADQLFSFHSKTRQPGSDRKPVVIIDDDSNDVILATELLAGAGIENPIVHLSDGIEAISYFQQCTATGGDLPILILLDLKMPRLDGFEVLRWMRDQPALAKVQTVVLTSSTAEEDIAKATLLGAKAFLTKHPSVMQIRTIFELVNSMRPVEELTGIVSRSPFA